MKFARFYKEDITTRDFCCVAIVFGFACAIEHNHLVFVVVAVVGGVAVWFNNKVPHREIRHPVLSAKQDSHRNAINTLELDGLGVGGVESGAVHGVIFQSEG